MPNVPHIAIWRSGCAAEGEAGGAVEHAAHGRHGALLAEEALAAVAVVAVAAGGHERQHDVVAGRRPRSRPRRPPRRCPAPSWPSTIGGGSGMVPFWTDRSEWHTPDATILTCTSPGPGRPISMSSWISSGVPTPFNTAAVVMIDPPGSLWCTACYRPCSRSSRSAAFTAYPNTIAGARHAEPTTRHSSMRVPGRRRSRSPSRRRSRSPRSGRAGSRPVARSRRGGRCGPGEPEQDRPEARSRPPACLIEEVAQLRGIAVEREVASGDGPVVVENLAIGLVEERVDPSRIGHGEPRKPSAAARRRPGTGRRRPDAVGSPLRSAGCRSPPTSTGTPRRRRRRRDRRCRPRPDGARGRAPGQQFGQRVVVAVLGRTDQPVGGIQRSRPARGRRARPCVRWHAPGAPPGARPGARPARSGWRPELPGGVSTSKPL